MMYLIPDIFFLSCCFFYSGSVTWLKNYVCVFFTTKTERTYAIRKEVH